MNETTQQITDLPTTKAGRDRTRQIIIVCSTALIVAFMAFWALVFKPVWPMAVGVVAVSAMVAALIYGLLRKSP